MIVLGAKQNQKIGGAPSSLPYPKGPFKSARAETMRRHCVFPLTSCVALADSLKSRARSKRLRVDWFLPLA